VCVCVCVCVSFLIVLFKHGLSVQILFGLTVYIKSKEVINISGVNSYLMRSDRVNNIEGGDII